jgi:hypothetical protein
MCRQHWQDSPESTRAAYRSALKAWLDYCDLLRRIDPAATNAPWPDTKVRHCLLQPWQQALSHVRACSAAHTGAVPQVAGFMSWRLQQLRKEGSENPAQVLSTARNAIRRVRMVMRGLPQRELTEEGKRLIGSIQHEAAQQTKEARLRCACSSCAAAVAEPLALSCQSPPYTAAVAGDASRAELGPQQPATHHVC